MYVRMCINIVIIIVIFILFQGWLLNNLGDLQEELSLKFLDVISYDSHSFVLLVLFCWSWKNICVNVQVVGNFLNDRKLLHMLSEKAECVVYLPFYQNMF